MVLKLHAINYWRAWNATHKSDLVYLVAYLVYFVRLWRPETQSSSNLTFWRYYLLWQKQQLITSTHPSENQKTLRRMAPRLFKPRSIESGRLLIASWMEEKRYGRDWKAFRMHALVSCKLYLSKCVREICWISHIVSVPLSPGTPCRSLGSIASHAGWI